MSTPPNELRYTECPICGAGVGFGLERDVYYMCQPKPHFDDKCSNAYLVALNASSSVNWYENCLEEIAAIVIRALDRVKVLSNAYLKYRFGFTDEETCSLIYHLLDMKVIKLRPIVLNQWGITLSEDGKRLFDPVPGTRPQNPATRRPSSPSAIGSQGYLTAVAGPPSVAEDIFKKKLIMQHLVRMLAQKKNEK